MHNGKVIKVFRAKQVEGKREPGSVEAGKDYLHVGTASGCLALEELQQEGKRRMTVEEFLRGYKIATGEKLS
jgi:methionyl-tRNA formyltransferase